MYKISKSVFTTILLTSTLFAIESDFNADGNMDLLTFNTDNKRANVWINTPSGTNSQYLKTSSSDLEIIKVADIDGNGKSDIVVLNTNNGRVNAWLTTDTSSTTKHLKTLSPFLEIVNIADMDGDGKDDVVLRNTANGRVNAWMSGAGDSVTKYLKTASSEMEIVGMGDINGDGKDDIVVKNTNNLRVNAWISTGGSSVTQYLKTLSSDLKIQGIADINGDGKDDIVVKNINNLRVNALISTAGTSVTQHLKTLSADLKLVTKADVNGDGKDDLIVQNTSNGRVNAWISTASQSTTQYLNTLETGIEIVITGDIDGDNREDILVLNTNNSRVNAWLNTVSGTIGRYLKTLGSNVILISEGEDENSQNTFYVSTSGDDANDGSLATPWRTIQVSVDKLSAGETLIVQAGTYNEKVLFSGEDDSGSEGNVITLKGESGAVIDGTGLRPTSQEALVGIHNAHHINVENLELRNFKTDTGFELTDTPVGIFIDGSSHDINIIRNNIHDIQNLSTCGQSSDCGPGANGIAVYGNSITTMTNLNFIENNVSNCILSSSEAFTINGNIDGFKVIGNYVHDNNNIGIDIIGYEEDVCSSCTEENNRARNGIVKNNISINNSTNLALGTFPNNPWYEGDDGSAGGFYVDGGHHLLFEGNYASQNDLGFEFASEHAGKSSNDILMVNNYIYNNREVGLTMGGYAESTSGSGGGNAENIKVYNNSFYKNKGWGPEIAFSYRVKNTVLLNNIIYGEDSLDDTFYIEDNAQESNITWGINLWYAEDISDTSNIQGQSFIVENPNYVNAMQGDLDIEASSPAINVGTIAEDISSWTDDFWENEFTNGIIPAHGSSDINGENRFNGAIDLGADEL